MLQRCEGVTDHAVAFTRRLRSLFGGNVKFALAVCQRESQMRDQQSRVPLYPLRFGKTGAPDAHST